MSSSIDADSSSPLKWSQPIKVTSGVLVAITVGSIVTGILALLATNGVHLGGLNAMSHVGNIGGGALLTLGVVVSLVLVGIAYWQAHKNSLEVGGASGELSKAELKKIDAIFTDYSDSVSAVTANRQLEITEGLKEIPRCVRPNLSKTPRSSEKIERDTKTINQLASSYKITERQGTTWGHDTVLMRGICSLDGYDTKKLFERSMTTIINQTFSEGMNPNGYIYKKNDEEGDELSVYHDDLVIQDNGKHNWLVSTSFNLETACVYAAHHQPGKAGIFFFIHATQEAMKKELFGVTSINPDEEEVAFVFVPPEYIIGAMPVHMYGLGGCMSWVFHKDYFVPNPLFHKGTTSFDQLESLGLNTRQAQALSSGSHDIITSSMVAYPPLRSDWTYELIRL